MQGFVEGLAGADFTVVMWVFLAFVVLHELEEWNVNAFERRHFSGMPAYATDRSARGYIFLFCVGGLLITVAATFAGDPASAWVFLPAVFFMLTNACQHAYWSIRFRAYAPGVGTALGLIVPLGLYLILRSVADARVDAVYPIVLAVISAAVWAQTVQAGDRMTGSVLGAYAAGNWIRQHSAFGGLDRRM